MPQKSGRVLIIDDMARVPEPLAQYLRDVFDIQVSSRDMALERARSTPPEVILICSDRVETLASLTRGFRIQSETREAGIVCIAPDPSAFTEKSSYDAGADLFLSGSLDFQSVQHMVNALVKRVEGFPTDKDLALRLGAIQLFPRSLKIKKGEMEWDLTPIQSKLLELFFTKRDELLSRELLRKKIWGHQKISNRSIDAQISKLRKTLPFLQECLESVYGGGYVFNTRKAS